MCFIYSAFLHHALSCVYLNNLSIVALLADQYFFPISVKAIPHGYRGIESQTSVLLCEDGQTLVMMGTWRAHEGRILQFWRLCAVFGLPILLSYTHCYFRPLRNTNANKHVHGSKMRSHLPVAQECLLDQATQIWSLFKPKPNQTKKSTPPLTKSLSLQSNFPAWVHK